MKFEIESKFNVNDRVEFGDRIVRRGVVAEVMLRKYACGYHMLYLIELINGGSIFRDEDGLRPDEAAEKA
nr:MAG TPA: hypothetical protein [Caudoviricetes sp.]